MAFKKYLEIVLTEELKDGETPTDIFREEVRDKAEAESKLVNAEKDFVDKKYIARLHICKHGENGHNQLCEVETLKEVK